MESGSRTTHLCPSFSSLAASTAMDVAAPELPPGGKKRNARDVSTTQEGM